MESDSKSIAKFSAQEQADETSLIKGRSVVQRVG
jgi:hypothetical protein